MKDIISPTILSIFAIVTFSCLSIISCKEGEENIEAIEPNFIIKASSFYPGDTIYFNNITIDVKNTEIEWWWDFGNGKYSNERDPWTIYDSAQTYVVKLTINSANGSEVSKHHSVEIIDKSDVHDNDFKLGFVYEFPSDYYDSIIYVGTPLKFVDCSIGIDSEIALRRWVFNESDTVYGKEVNYSFNSYGDKALSLQVIDNNGFYADTTIYLKVYGSDFEPWKPGYLDIHHINTGRGDATFFIFPDGTNMLFDAGDKDVPGSGSTPDFPVHPNGTKTPGEWIAYYIAKFIPDGFPLKIDYAVISHFHVDHLGRINKHSPKSTHGDYRLGGITQVAEILPIQKVIDRAYPEYDFPVDLISDRDDIENYVKFLHYQMGFKGMEVEKIQVGSASQIKGLYDRSYDFRVVNLYANGEFGIKENRTHTVTYDFPQPLVKNGQWNGNPLSIALKLEYGQFGYYTGGDITGVESWPDYDIETPLGEIIGEVDVMVLNHHGYKDATNQNFTNSLLPQVTIQQTSNVNHVHVGILNRLRAINADLFISNMGDLFASTAIADYYKSIEGHVVIRVYEGGSEFEIFILNDRSEQTLCMKKYGIYQSR